MQEATEASATFPAGEEKKQVETEYNRVATTCQAAAAVNRVITVMVAPLREAASASLRSVSPTCPDKPSAVEATGRENARILLAS